MERAALKRNAEVYIFSHNNLYGMEKSSKCDENLTGKFKRLLALVYVRVLDHLVVRGEVAMSFAERGLL